MAGRGGRPEDGGRASSGRRGEPPRDNQVSRPELPADSDASELDREVRKELLTLPKGLADLVGSHLVMAGRVLEDDPQLALTHARYARSKAGRVAAVREAAGLAAYHAGEWSEALAELRAARRLGGGPGRLAVLADCERALGRPERALEIARSPEAGQLGTGEAVELRIVAAGARRDLGQFDAAVIALQGPDLDAAGEEPWRARLRYAYADNLLAAGREQDAIRWFLAAVEADAEEATDAAERAVELSERPEPE
jgi:tetratricopeptide (TPR) repeat protein